MMTPLEQEILTIVNQIPAAIEKAFMDVFVLRHPGHANQKTHGNRFGSGQAKESLRRLKDDKGAREAYKATARKRVPSDAKDIVNTLSKPANQGFSSAYNSFDDFIKTTKEVHGEASVTHTKGKRGDLYKTSTSGYIKLGDRIISLDSGLKTERLFEKIQTDKGFKEWLGSVRQLSSDLKKLRK